MSAETPQHQDATQAAAAATIDHACSEWLRTALRPTARDGFRAGARWMAHAISSASAKPDLAGCEQLYDCEGVTLESNKPFAFTCCDCGLTHHMIIVSEDGKPIGFAIKRTAVADPCRAASAKEST